MDSPAPKPSIESSGGWSRRAALRTYVPPALAVLVAASGQNFSETGVNRVQRQDQSANRQGGAGAATGLRDQNVQARQDGGAGPSGNGAGGNQPAAIRSQPVQARQDGGNGNGGNGGGNNNNQRDNASQARDNSGASRQGGGGDGRGAAGKKNRNN